MTDVPRASLAQLPASHYFITVARGAVCRTVTVRTFTARLCVAGLALLGCWTVASSLYLGFHDDLVASLMDREARAQYAYEDRIAALRGQIDRESSRDLVGRSALEGELEDLAKRAAALETRAGLVAQAVTRVGLPRLAARDRAPQPSDATDQTGSVPAPDVVAPPSWRDKPHPEAEADHGMVVHRAEAADRTPLRTRLSTLVATLGRIDAAQYQMVSDAGQVARHQVAAFRTALADAGLSPERFAPVGRQRDVGGPFVPLDGGLDASSFGQAWANLQLDVSAAERLGGAMPRVPFASPLTGDPDVTSPFGARVDPFLGRPALHTGVDLRESLGTDVRVTADGRVVGAGPVGGYGTMIEVDHGNGLTTRYAHLSAVSVAPGDSVTKGQVVGQVGMTGRATGPHLHYETRIDGEPVDPMRFLQAGHRLALADANLSNRTP